MDAGSTVSGPTGDAGFSDAGVDEGTLTDAGTESDAGTVADAGTDGGSPIFTPKMIGTVPCPGAPQLLWSHPLSVDADFRGAADEDGNLYWTEYDPSPNYPPSSDAGWLVSANKDGRVRYRVRAPAASAEGAFLIADGRVVMSRYAVFAAYDVATGAPAWSLDLTSPGYPTNLRGIAHMGNGKLAFALYTYSWPTPGTSGIYIVDVVSGGIVWSSILSDAAEYSVEAADGAGSVLATVGRPTDAFVIDSSGQLAWKKPNPGSLVAWPSGPPWLSVYGAPGIASESEYLAVPGEWFAVVMGNELGFAFDYGTNPLTIHAIRGGTVVADGTLADTDTREGVGLLPFLAGDHLVLVAQNSRGNPGLCHPARFGAASVSRFDTTDSYQCPLSFEGESAITGAALLPGRLVIGRVTFLTTACTNQVQPQTIEAYSLPGESLAPAGWVQRAGSPGLGARPIVH